MPHDKKGRKLAAGDFIRYERGTIPTIGRILEVVEEAAAVCNLKVERGASFDWLPARETELTMLADGSTPSADSPTYRQTNAGEVDAAAKRGGAAAIHGRDAEGFAKKAGMVLAALLFAGTALADAPAPKPSPTPTPRVVAPLAVVPSPEAAPLVESIPDRACVDETDCACAGLKGYVVCVPASPAVRPSPVLLAVPKAKPAWWPVLDLTMWTVQLDGGLQSVILNSGERREYATAAVEFAGPYVGFDLWQRSEVLGEQDGGRLNIQNPQSFRAVLVDAKISRAVSPQFAFAVRSGMTLSIEGGQFAPLDSRLLTLQGEASIKLSRLILRGYGGHDGAVGGYGIGGAVEIPVMGGRPQIITSFDYPMSFAKTRPTNPLPWQFKAGARIIIAKEFLSDLF